MPISRISAQALRILGENPSVRIHSVFTSAVNLRAGERLIACSSGAVGAPHGLELTPDDLARLQRLQRSASGEALDWCARERTMTSRSSGLRIHSIATLTVFDPSLPVTSGCGGARVGELIGHLTRSRARTGLGEDWPALVADRRLGDVLASLRIGTVDGPVLYWLGRGPGLTPSGDDVLVGMLAALWFMQLLDPTAMPTVRRSFERAARHRTTDISAEYLHYACRGMVIGPLRDVLVALDRCELSRAVAAVDRLGQYGHTSGMDCLLGALTGLHHLARLTPPGAA